MPTKQFTFSTSNKEQVVHTHSTTPTPEGDIIFKAIVNLSSQSGSVYENGVTLIRDSQQSYYWSEGRVWGLSLHNGLLWHLCQDKEQLWRVSRWSTLNIRMTLINWYLPSISRKWQPKMLTTWCRGWRPIMWQSYSTHRDTRYIP